MVSARNQAFENREVITSIDRLGIRKKNDYENEGITLNVYENK